MAVGAPVRPHGDGWRNLLVWGDNLLALPELLAEQQGTNRFDNRGKIKLIYIDPPFATRQDFMKDKEKAYRDKIAWWRERSEEFILHQR